MKVREICVPYTEATGPCKARAQAQYLWRGEGYYLQIDAHMRFVQGWDSQLKRELVEAEKLSNSGKAVLSTYPSGKAEILTDNRRVSVRCC